MHLFSSLILSPALPCPQSCHLILADSSSCTLLQTPHAHMCSHLCACKSFITERKSALKYMGLDITAAAVGSDGREAELGNSAFCRHGALLRWRGEHDPRALIPSAMQQTSTKHHSFATPHVQTPTALKVSQLPFLVHPFPLLFACLSGPDHITVTAAMISAFSDRCICFCHSQQSSLAPSLPPNLSQGSITGKHGQRYLLFLYAEDYSHARAECTFSGCPAFK